MLTILMQLLAGAVKSSQTLFLLMLSSATPTILTGSPSILYFALCHTVLMVCCISNHRMRLLCKDLAAIPDICSVTLQLWVQLLVGQTVDPGLGSPPISQCQSGWQAACQH